MGDFIVISVLILITAIIIYSSVKNRKKGGHCGGCSKCSNASSCCSTNCNCGK